MKRIWTALAISALLLACSPQTQAGSGTAKSQDAPTQAASVERHPISGLRLVDVTISGLTGKHVFRSEVASTFEAQQRGMMFRTEMADDEGMIFPSDPPSARSFWMKNTPIPLDIIFVGTDGRISNIAANTPPYSLDSVASVGLTSAVFEIRGGLAEELGIQAGDEVSYVLPE